MMSAGFAYSLGLYNKITVHPRGISTSSTPTTSPVPDTFNQGRAQTILLMGYGGGKHEGGLLTDTIMLVIIDPPTHTVTLLSLPRDLWVQLPISGDKSSGWKINAAYAIGSDDRGYRYKPVEYTGPAGGGQLAKYAVNEVTGVTVDKFVTLNFSGFKRSIDVLGGVEVNVEKTFDDYLYPIEGKESDPCGKSELELKSYATMAATASEQAFGCRYEHLHFDKGMTHMDGETALKYVRSRHSAQDGSDFGRAARQRNLVLAVKDKVFRLDFFPKIIPFASSLSDDLKTDYDLAGMQEFLRFKGELQGYRITSAALTEENTLMYGRSEHGESILMSREGLNKWDNVHTWVTDELQRLRHPEQATPAATATSSTKIISH